MTNGQLVEAIVKHAKAYVKDGVMQSVKRNSHMNDYSGEKISKSTTDAIVVDFVNFIALQYGIDLAMYTSDLRK
jgi:hypothetical protein